MIKHILVPLDTSPFAESAIPTAVRIARAAGASLIFCNVVPVPVEYRPYAVEPSSLNFSQNMLDNEQQAADRYLAEVAKRSDLAGIETSSISSVGTATQQILDLAADYEIDLIVMSSHGSTGFKGLLMGSVAKHIVRHSRVPVLILREGTPNTLQVPAEKKRPFRVMVPLDESPLAETILPAAAELAAYLAAPAQGALHLVRVLHFAAEAKNEPPDSLVEQAMKDAQDYMRVMDQQLQEGVYAPLHLQVTWSVEVDKDIANRIVQLAETGEDMGGFGGCDVIALATHGRSLFQRWAMGSVTESVLGATKLPLLTMRPDEDEIPAESSTAEEVAEEEESSRAPTAQATEGSEPATGSTGGTL